MRVNIHEMYYKNIREMKDLTIDLCDSGTPKPISLIQMPTGVGKTTTMELIRYCFDGSASDLNEKKILSFKPPGTDVKNGEFRAKISVDEKVRFVTIKFDYENASVKYTTSKTSEKGGGETKGWKLGLEIEPWLKDKEFVRLFVFDGELAGELLSLESTSAEAAINALYLLNTLRGLFEEGSGGIDRILNEMITSKLNLKGTGVQTKQALKALETKQNNATKHKQKMISEKDAFTRKLVTARTNIRRAEEKIELIRKENEQLIREYERLKARNKLLESHILEKTENLLKTLRFPHNLSDDIFGKLKTLATQMGKLKLPKTQSMEFFEELSESPECICGRPIGDKEKRVIKEKAREFLTEDNIGEINSIKTSIRNLPKRERIGELIQNIKDINRSRKLNERNISMLDRKTKGKDKIDDLNEKIDKWRIKELNLDSVITALTEKRKEEQEVLDLDWRTNIDLCEKRIADLQAQRAEASGTVEFKNKASVLKNILKQIHGKSLVRLKGNILSKTNEKIERILKSKDIRISKIGNCLSLRDRSGVSEGQKLSIAYAFLSTLFSESPHHLPFIVDTPAAPLDLKVRREVAEILPSLFSQIVVFITSGERDGFADQFYSRKSDCLFYTVRKEKIGVRLERDIEFFKGFQSED